MMMTARTLNDFLKAERSVGYLQTCPAISCVDGFTMSVQASANHYCSPKDNNGPWYEVEVGFPSKRQKKLMRYAENGSKPTDTIYGGVPIHLVVEIINKHGGIL